jgi:hypothetical protein
MAVVEDVQDSRVQCSGRMSTSTVVIRGRVFNAVNGQSTSPLICNPSLALAWTPHRADIAPETQPCCKERLPRL